MARPHPAELIHGCATLGRGGVEFGGDFLG